MEKKVSIIIPNYNGKDLLQKNLRTVIIAANKYSPTTEIIVVDDGSTDESVKFIRDNFAQVKVILNDKNRGFSSTCNTGVKNAQGEIVVLLNTDLSPDPDFLNPLLTHFKNENVFAVGCLEKSFENGKTILRGRGVGFFRQGLLIHQKGEVDKDDTLWVSGGSAAFSRTKWKELGGFDEIYDPFYWEDIDLSYRALKKGWRVIFERKSVVYHEHAKGVIKTTFKNSHIEAIAFRNQLIFLWKNITDTGLFIDHIFWLPTHLGRFLLSGKESFLRGFLLALGRLPQIIVKRFGNKSLLTDRQVLGRFL